MTISLKFQLFKGDFCNYKKEKRNINVIYFYYIDKYRCI